MSSAAVLGSPALSEMDKDWHLGRCSSGGTQKAPDDHHSGVVYAYVEPPADGPAFSKKSIPPLNGCGQLVKK
jgi:hypothetical protein